MQDLNKVAVTNVDTARAINLNTVNTAPAKVGSTEHNNPTGFCTFSSGSSAALLQALQSEILMQSQLISYTAEQESNMIQANTASASGQAAATINAGIQQSNVMTNQANGQIASGFSMIAGSAASAGASFIHMGIESNGGYGNGEETTWAASQLKTLRSKVQNSEPTTEVTLASRAANIEQDKCVNNMVNGKFDFSKEGLENQIGAANSNILGQEEKAAILKKIDSRIAEINTTVQGRGERVQGITNFINMGGQAAGNLSQGYLNVAAAKCQQEQAYAQAQESIYQNLSQQASNTANTMDAKLKSVYDEELSEFQAYVQAAAVGSKG